MAAPGRPCHPWVPLPGALCPLSRLQTGLGAHPHCRHWMLPNSTHSVGLDSLGPSRTCFPPLPPQPSALVLSPQESRNPSRPGSGPLARLVASPPVTPGGQLWVWPHQLLPPGHGRGLWEQPVPPACVSSPFRGWKTGGSPLPAPHPRTGQLRNRVCCDSLRGLLPRGSSAQSERASQASRGHLGGFGGNCCPAAWLRFLGLREAQSQAPHPPTGRALGWVGLKVARGWGRQGVNKSSGKSAPGPWSPAGAPKGPEELGGNPQGGQLGGFYRVPPSQQHPGEVGPAACGERRDLCAAGPRPQSVGQSPNPESWAIGAAPSTRLPESGRLQAWGWAMSSVHSLHSCPLLPIRAREASDLCAYSGGR